ncbi:MAG TPA: histidine kinase [Puia sp.]|nr:histidine kinase [Puia sp.]
MVRFLDYLVYSKSSGYRLGRHLLLWLLYFTLFRFMMVQVSAAAACLWALLFLPLNASFVYFILYRLAPRYLMRFEYWPFFLRYCLSLVGCLTIGFYLGYRFIYAYFPPLPYPRPATAWQVLATIFDPVLFSVVNLTTGIGVFIKIYKFWRAEAWLRLQLVQEKARAELELLKAQIQPSFLKSTLGHLHSLLTAGSEKAPPLLMRLSAVLSYILYECRETEVPLEREISICKEYITLESERHGSWLEVSVDTFGSFAGRRIAPLVLLPLIGNAFPERPAKEAGAWMAFEFSIDGSQLLVRVIESARRLADLQPVRAANASTREYLDRLQVLYGSRMTFDRKEREAEDIVSLTIELEPPAAKKHADGQQPIASLYRYAIFDY